MIEVLAPKVQVLLHKTIMRKTTNGGDAVSARFSGSVDRQVVDLAPFLGDGSTVTTTKSVTAPAGGFSLALVDKPDSVDGKSFESLYGLIEPMDMIEIRGRHGAPLDPNKPPIIMRGFVSDVRRVESAGGDGRPARMVMVTGQDYGKVWQIIQISYLANYLIGSAYISGFPLFEQYGISNNVLGADEFAKEVLAKIINPYLAAMLPANSTLPNNVVADVSVAAATVSPGIQAHQGTIYEMLRYYGDVGPWNELFMEDREEGVFMVYRANPYLKTDGSGAKIQSEAPDPVYIDVPITDVVEMNVSRSDSDVANFYWVQSPRFNLIFEAQRRQEATAASQDTVVLADYPNSDVKFYGNRVMVLDTQQGSSAMGTHDAGRAASDFNQLGSAAVTFMDTRRKVVVDSNKDNIVLERGSIRIKGNEKIKAGVYLRIARGQLVSTYYVSQVDHQLTPYQSFITSVSVERGTGFIERVKSGSISPYYEDRNK